MTPRGFVPRASTTSIPTSPSNRSRRIVDGGGTRTCRPRAAAAEDGPPRYCLLGSPALRSRRPKLKPTTSLTHEAAAGNPHAYVQLKAGHSQGSITERYIHAAQVLFPGAASRGEERMFGGVGSNSGSN
jgi:hypothetical protein